MRYRRKPGDATSRPRPTATTSPRSSGPSSRRSSSRSCSSISWQTLNAVDASVGRRARRRIRAVAGQFQWTFDYLDRDGDQGPVHRAPPIGDGGGMFVPAGRTVQLQLCVSPDVIHAFYVPQFLFKRDVVPGRTTTFDFNVDAADAGQTFHGQCAELCGTGHSIDAVRGQGARPADFDAWLAGQVAKANATPPPPPSVAPAPSGPARRRRRCRSARRDPVRAVRADGAGRRAVPRSQFENKDAGIAHNVAIHRVADRQRGLHRARSSAASPTKTYDVPPLAAAPTRSSAPSIRR